MRSILAPIIGVLIISGITFTARWLLRRTNARIWNIHLIDRFGFYLPYLTYALIAVSFISFRLKLDYVTPVSMALLFILVIISFILEVSLPFSLAVDWC